MAISTNPNLLQNIKDIHLPLPITMWPKTFGWYILVVLLVVITIYATLRLCRYYLKKTGQKKIIDELNHLVSLYSKSPTESLEKISILLRRIALAAFPRKDVAGLSGEAWLHFLDREWEKKGEKKEGASDRFTNGVGRALISTPYQSDRSKIDVDIKELSRLIENWIRQVI